MARTTIHIGEETIKASTRLAYVKVLGGDIIWFSPSTADKTEFKAKSRGMQARRLGMHVPGIVLVRILICGVLINAWTQKKIVKMPADSRAWINEDHQVVAAIALVANVVRKAWRSSSGTSSGM